MRQRHVGLSKKPIPFHTKENLRPLLSGGETVDKTSSEKVSSIYLVSSHNIHVPTVHNHWSNPYRERGNNRNQ